jgi:shikimate dehydrogenase
MMRAGVVGDPIAHSLSPLIHGAWIEALGLDATYDRFHVRAEDFAAFVRRDGSSLTGLNVTIPHKEAALALADTASDLARACGAANVLLVKDGRIEARNTDGEGLLGAFRAQAPDVDITAAPILILGAGGAARGAVAALVQAGARDIRIINRTRAKADAIAAESPQAVRAFGDDYWTTDVAADAVGAVVNSTSLGLNGGEGPFVDWTRTRPGAVAMDMVYRPLDTTFLKAARSAGRRTVDGLEMLIRQAIPSFEYFYGAVPPETVDVRALCLAALG